MPNDAKVQQGEKLFDERTLVIKTSLPCESDEEIDERYNEVQDLIDRLETIIEHLFTPGGQYHKPGYSLKMDRK